VKRCVKNDAIRHLAVPQYETLKVEHLLEFLDGHPDVKLYFPIKKEIYKLPKQFIVNVLFTKVGGPFSQWVKARIV
jgi:hypothetical protein